MYELLTYFLRLKGNMRSLSITTSHILGKCGLSGSYVGPRNQLVKSLSFIEGYWKRQRATLTDTKGSTPKFWILNMLQSKVPVRFKGKTSNMSVE